MRRALIAVLSFAAVTGCGHSASVPSNSSAVVPFVVQSGGSDTWERYLLGDSVNPGNITPGPDGNMWFTDSGTPAIVRITMAGIVTSFPLNDPLGYSPSDITTGPDQALWFTDEAPYIGRMTTAGALTRYSLAAYGVNPLFITTGADGNLWFTARSGYGASVGRITTGGAITMYTIGKKNVNPGGITAGPDGNVWFTEAGTDKVAGTIGRITPAGVMTLFPADPSGPRPRYIVEAGDHQLYYQDTSFHWAVVRVDAATGATTRIGRLNFYSIFKAVPVGPDSLWYMSGCHCPIGAVRRFSLRNGSNQIEDVSPYPEAFGRLALGPDGNLWIASTDRSIDIAVRRSMHVSPMSLTLRPGEAAIVTVTETDYTKLFRATSGNTNVLTIRTQNPSSGSFTVQAGNKPGTTTLTLQDRGGNSASIPVTVTSQ